MKERKSLTENLFEDFPDVTAVEWKAEIVRDLGSGDLGKLDWKPYEGFTVAPFYTEDDLGGVGYLTGQVPGEFPYARGNGDKSNEWKINEYIASGSVKEANRLALDSLGMGAESLTFVCEAGHGSISGIPVQSSRDMSLLLRDVPLEDVPVHFKCGLGAQGILSLFILEAGRRGLDKKKLRGSVDADPLKSLATGGSFPSGERRAFGEIGSMISYLSVNMPSFGALGVSGRHFHDSGASAAQELAFTLASGVEYMDRLTNMDLPADRVAPHMRFSFSIGSSYFMEIAKLRAARLLWAYVIEEYGAENESSKKMIIDATTSSWNQTVFDPYVNMLRGTVEAMAAAVGGCESLNVLPFDSGYNRTDAFSRRMARNTQLILKNESRLDRVVDPSGGSYYIEKLTDTLAEAAWGLFKTVEGMGGLVEALKSGFVQGEIRKTREKRDNDIATGRAVLLGTNQYPNPGEKGPKRIDAGLPEKPLRRSGEKAKRPDESVAAAMEGLMAWMTKKKSLLGDVVPEEPAGPKPAVTPLRPYRGGEPFEEMRLAALKYKKETGLAPAVFLLPVGSPSMRNARASFTANFFGCAGFRILGGSGSGSAGDGVKAALKSSAKIVVICSSDREYPGLAPEICGALRAKDPGIRILIAGNPAEHIEALKASGIDDFIHARTNAVLILRKYQELTGIRNT